MRKYILKRLLIAVPTLLGITVMTFCLIRLAPGDPGALDAMTGEEYRSRPVSREMVEENRKLYGLDKPVLINLDVKDRRRAVQSALEEIEDIIERIRETPDRSPSLEEDLQESRRKLAGYGKRLIPYLVSDALSMPEGDGLSIALEALREGAGVDAGRSREDLARWWAERGASFSDETIRDRLGELENAPEVQVPALIDGLREELGELLLPEAMERIGRLQDGPERRRLVALAAPWAGYTRDLGPGADDERFETALLFLEKWWERESLLYREIKGFERFLRTFTEAQYPIWLGRILRLDFGESYVDFRPVTGKVFEAFKVTLSFQVIVIFLIYLISVPIGVYSAVKQDSILDRLITVGLFLLYSLPNFWVAYLLILFLCGGRFADLFPLQGLSSAGAESMAFLPWLFDRLWHMVLPVACMTYGGLAVLSRYARAGMLEVIRQDYIRTARAKGLSERAVILKHALRNGAIPIVTLIGGLLPALISGSVIIETIFNIPGMGRLGFTAVFQRDYPVVMAIAFFSAVLVLLGMLLSDLLYAVVDPRIRYGEKG